MKEIKKCKKCQRSLPEGYKYKRCENCRNKYIKRIRDAGKTVAGVAVSVGATAITILTIGKINLKK